MGTVLDALGATLCVLGLTGACWWLLGRLLRPLSGQSGYVLLAARGEGEKLEQMLRGYLWLRSLGLLKAPILIADLGLNETGRKAALVLARRWPGVVLLPPEELGGFLNDYE